MDDENSLEGALREAFEEPEGASVLSRLGRIAGVRSRILLHEPAGDESPLLRVTASRSDQGATDDSRYQIVGEIARGGVGVVYKARDKDLGRDIALKVLRKEHARRPEVVERLIEEAQIGGQLQHPGIVPIYGFGLQQDGRPHIAMKLIKGRTFGAILKERKDPARKLARFLRIFEQTCQAMGYAHTRGVIHRDLKPSNVMVGGFGEVQVVDWGFGKVLGHDDPMAERLKERTIVATVRSRGEGSESLVGSIMGTPAYMPPEQALGQIDDLDERSDVFSLGAILCEILTGKPPYAGEPKDLIVMAAHGRLDDAHTRLDACTSDPELVALCRQALAPLRADRPENAGVLAETIEHHLAAADERAHQAEVRAVHERARLKREREEADWARRAKRKTTALAAITLLTVALAGAAWFWSDAQQRNRADQLRATARSALDEATRLLGAQQWSEAAAKARSAKDLAANDDRLATEAQALADRAGSEAERVQSRDRLLAALDEARMMRADDFDSAATDALYLDALATAGLDFANASAGDLAKTIQREYADAIESIAVALDDWAWLRRTKPELESRDWKSVLAVARSIDPDPWTNRLRDAVASKNLDDLLLLAAEAFDRDLPLRALDLLGIALSESGGEAGGVAAAGFYEKLRTMHPGDFWVQAHASIAGDPGTRVACATAALALRPRSLRAHIILGGALLKHGDLDGAIAAHREAIRLNPDYANAHTGLGSALSRKGDLDGAIAACREAIRLQPDEFKAHNNLGAALLTNGDLDGAIAAYREAIRLKPDSAVVHNNLGDALIRNDDLDGAIVSYREAIRLKSDSAAAHAHTGLGNALSRKGDFDGAIAACREAIRLKPDSADAHANLGYALKGKGDLDGAIVSYREAIRLKPDDAEAHVHLGSVLKNKGDVGGAIAASREAIRLKPDYAMAHNNLGAALSDGGDLDGAIASYREAIRLEPELVLSHRNLGTALSRKGDLDGAIASYREAIRLEPGVADTHESLGVALCRKGDLDGGIASYREAIRLKPDYAWSHYNLGLALFFKGDLDGAIVSYREAIRLKPENFVAHNNLGNALLGKGDLDGAIAAYRKAIRLQPDYADAHRNLGIALLQKGDLDGAIVSWREAIRLKPGVADTHGNLGAALSQKGDLDGAIASCREAIRLKPENFMAHYNLGNALLKKGDLDGAIAALREAARLKPDFAEAHDNLGGALSRKGDLEGAIAAHREAIRLKPDFAEAHANLGGALSRKGDLEGAIASHREAARLKPDFAEAHCNLGHALGQQGRFREALESLRRGHALGSQRADWRYPSRKWVEDAERRVDLEERLPAILAGAAQPRDAEECAGFAEVCYRKRRFAESARLYAKAFGLGVTRPEHRYNAACAGVLTNTPKWRRRALGWLRAELERHAKGPAAAKASLQHWKRDADLSAVRDRIDALPEAERAGWRKLWADVEALLKQAEGK